MLLLPNAHVRICSRPLQIIMKAVCEIMTSPKIDKLFARELQLASFSKIVFSKPVAKENKKAEARLVTLKLGVCLQITYLKSDNKAVHRNVDLSNASNALSSMLGAEFYNCVIITNDGNCDIKRSIDGRLTITDKISAAQGCVSIAAHDRAKRHMLSNDQRQIVLLRALGLADGKGVIIPARRNKYNQINRFLEILADCVGDLPGDKVNIVDLCCGKAYLSLNAHAWLEQNSARSVSTLAVDMKGDVVRDLQQVVVQAELNNVRIIEGDISVMQQPFESVDIVMSLHACNTATDRVLFDALQWQAKVILCSPCCQLELATFFDKSFLGELTRYPLLSGRLCELLTDAIRANILALFGYTVQILEFVDRDNTHKNTLIRAVKKHHVDYNSAIFIQELTDIDNLCARIGGQPLLRRLVDQLIAV